MIKTCGFLSTLPLNKIRQELSEAVAETLSITKQKKSFKGVCVNHGALERQIFACPVKALARRVTHIRVHKYDGTKFLCAYWDSVVRGNVTDRDMIFRMKFVAAKLGYPSRNIAQNRIDTHLNQARGACAMELEGFDDESIRKMEI